MVQARYEDGTDRRIAALVEAGQLVPIRDPVTGEVYYSDTDLTPPALKRLIQEKLACQDAAKGVVSDRPRSHRKPKERAKTSPIAAALLTAVAVPAAAGVAAAVPGVASFRVPHKAEAPDVVVDSVARETQTPPLRPEAHKEIVTTPLTPSPTASPDPDPTRSVPVKVQPPTPGTGRHRKPLLGGRRTHEEVSRSTSGRHRRDEADEPGTPRHENRGRRRGNKLHMPIAVPLPERATLDNQELPEQVFELVDGLV